MALREYSGLIDRASDLYRWSPKSIACLAELALASILRTHLVQLVFDSLSRLPFDYVSRLEVFWERSNVLAGHGDTRSLFRRQSGCGTCRLRLC